MTKPPAPTDTHFADVFADHYDLVYPPTPDIDDLIAFLEQRQAPPGSVLEFGVGTGRVALPLARHGFTVHGVDASPRMLSRLADKNPDGLVTTTCGDFSELALGRTFDFVIAPYNALYCAASPQEQIAAFNAMAEHTRPGGYTIIESFDPSLLHVQQGTSVSTRPIGDEGIMIESIDTVPEHQYAIVSAVFLRDGSPPLTATSTLRYIWPAEMDLYAGVVGLEPEDRYLGWNGEAFRAGTTRRMTISVYRRPD
ncbi:class I SAM-dependent methyltransferase [Kitasatospora sp. NPDC059827]|uniref:class I SAM-dependent methyltransferase n=1 Tax=Kitasatospora sp. NPDC059827 TaxID=3346964 RepID=UPI00364A29F3